jgi:hypothetical protein
VDGLERAKADLARGDARKARDRLKGLVGAYPDSLEVRQLLAEACRRDRQPAQAGRWGYLYGPHASDREREAFERHNSFVGYPRVTEARLRRILRTDDLSAIADDSGRALLRELPTKHPLTRADGPLEALSRRLAVFRARRAWRPTAVPPR